MNRSGAVARQVIPSAHDLGAQAKWNGFWKTVQDVAAMKAHGEAISGVPVVPVLQLITNKVLPPTEFVSTLHNLYLLKFSTFSIINSILNLIYDPSWFSSCLFSIYWVRDRKSYAS